MAAQFVVCVFLVLELSAIIVNCDVQLDDSCREFSTELVDATAFARDKRRVVVSPYSIWSVRFSVALGANSTTAGELYKALRLPEDSDHALIKGYRKFNDRVLKTDDENVLVMNENYMFLDDDFRTNPLFDAITAFGMGIESKTLNFNDTELAARLANDFISSSGFKSEIKLNNYFFGKSRMLMYSRATFKAPWKLRFELLDTTIEPFHNEDGNIIHEVFMMRQRNRFAFTHVKEIEAFVLELPYGSDGKYCILIVLPSPGKFIKEVYRKLVKLTVVNILDRLDNDTQNYGLANIEVRLPRFEIKTHLKSRLDEALTEMGTSEMFDSVSADFSRLTKESVFVSTVDHYADIHVSESGTVGSSATTVVFVDSPDKSLFPSGTYNVFTEKKSPIYSPGFIANRPFIYLVIEKITKSIMYGGAYGELTVFK